MITRHVTVQIAIFAILLVLTSGQWGRRQDNSDRYRNNNYRTREWGSVQQFDPFVNGPMGGGSAVGGSSNKGYSDSGGHYGNAYSSGSIERGLQQPYVGHSHSGSHSAESGSNPPQQQSYSSGSGWSNHG